jgi:hypothetical protein
MKNQKPLDPLQIRLLRQQRQPVKPHHLPALLHEFELGIGRESIQGPLQPFSEWRGQIRQPTNSLDNRHIQAPNGANPNKTRP